MLPVSSLTSSVLAILYIILSIKVIKLRKHHKVSIGGHGVNELEMTIRAHGNFAEYTPIFLIMLICAEANRGHWFILLLLAVLFILGRLAHARAFLYEDQHFKYRTYGMVLTFITIVFLALSNIVLLAIGSSSF